MIKFIRQKYEYGCGGACISMILNSRGLNIDNIEIENKGLIDKNSKMSFFQMSTIFEKYLVNAISVRTPINNINRINTPFIILINDDHFVIVEKILFFFVKVIDPAKGIKYYYLKKFKKKCKNKEFENNLVAIIFPSK